MGAARKTRAAKRAAAASASGTASQDADIHVDETATQPAATVPNNHESNTHSPSSTTLEASPETTQVSLTMGMTPSSFSFTSSSSSSSSSPRRTTRHTIRQPFSEVSANVEQPQVKADGKKSNITLTVQGQDENMSPTPKKKNKGKKKGAGKKKKQDNEPPKFNLVVVEDKTDLVVPDSPASDEAVEILRHGSINDEMVLEDKVRPSSGSPSPAVEAISRYTTGASSPVVVETEDLAAKPPTSPSDSIASPAVQKLESLFEPQETGTKALSIEMPVADNFQSNTQLPATPSGSTGKLSPREDAIEALDALEDAIDEVGKAINLAHSPESPTAQSTKTVDAKGDDQPEKVDNVAVEESPASETPVPEVPVPKTVSKPIKRVATKTTSTAKPNTSAKREASVRKVSPPSKGSATTAPAETSAESTKLKKAANPEPVRAKPTIAALQTPPRVLKSSKPLTKPVSQPLPGEAVAAQMKAKREARLKQKEEEEKSKRELKGRPATTAQPPSVEVKLTAAALARMKATASEKMASPEKAQTVKHGATTSAKRQSTMMGDERKASTLAIRSKPTEVTASSSSSLSGTVAAKPTDKDEREKKIEAARRARVEAAERGRLASREWAEKRKLKTGGTITGGASSKTTGSPTAAATAV